MKIDRIDINSKEYPENLRNITNPPNQLYVTGNIELLSEKNIAVVGSRKYTVYGKNVAMMVGSKLSLSEINVVSGLAYGIDSFVHEGVLNADGKGKCIAVLGSGLKKMTPQKNKWIFDVLLEKGGVVVSEYEPDFEATKWSFPQRNRIISGLSEGVVVIEANFNSGALITAQYANEQGKTVYAVPGNINSQFSMGSNLLIRDGASPLVVIDDVVRDMGRSVKTNSYPGIKLDKDEILIINEIKNYNGVTPDIVADHIGRNIGFVNSIVTVLEIKGLVNTANGKIHLAGDYNSC